MKIAIVKLSALGDIIHTMCALQFIKKEYPDSTIHWIVEKSFMQVLEYNPHIDKIITVNLKAIKKNKKDFFAEYKKLKNIATNKYDIIIDAQGLLKSAFTSWLIRNKNIKYNIAGFDKSSIREKLASLFYSTKINISYKQNVIERNMKILSEPLGFTIQKKEILEKKAFLYCKKIFNQKDYIVFVVGASKDNKIYPKEKFLELSFALKHKILVVWGNEKEFNIALWLNQHNPKITIAPQGNLETLKSIIKNSKLIIGGDTGPTHMAWGFNIPSITIFGNTPAYRNTYETSINKTISSSNSVDPLKLDKNDYSIKEIPVKKILNILESLI